jgi:hypothetical protein
VFTEEEETEYMLSEGVLDTKLKIEASMEEPSE